MSKHTPEPWIVEVDDYGRARRITDSDGEHIQYVCPTRHYDDSAIDPEAEASIARIVACVNACKGINPEAIPDLLEACKELLEYWDNGTPVRAGSLAANRVCSAIAKAERGNA